MDFWPKKHKKAGSRKANRIERNMRRLSVPRMVMSKHSIQRYRERGVDTVPVIKSSNSNRYCLAAVVTVLPWKDKSAFQRAKTSVKRLLPYLRKRRCNPMDSLPREIESIFNHGKRVLKKTNEERRNSLRLAAHRKHGYYQDHNDFFESPNKRQTDFLKI